nr:glycosyltransferase 87 family protein [Nocardioides albus]
MLHEIRVFIIVNVIGFAVAALLSVWFLARTHRRRPWDAAAFALAPVLAVTGVINWDMLAVVFVAGALWAWSRDRPLLTGILIGLGCATKLYPLFLLGGLVVICLRRRRYYDLAVAALATILAWVLANLPAMATGLEQWKVFWSFNSERGPDLGSLWLVAQQASDAAISAQTVNLVSWAFFIAWCSGVLIIGLTARETPRLAQLGFLIVAGFLLVNKVYSPQYVLWLLPLAVLAVPRWRDQLIWQAGELIYFVAVWWYLADLLAGSGGDQPAYWFAILARVAAEVYLVVVVVREIYEPWRDPVRWTEAREEAEDSQPSRTISSNEVAV